MKLALEIGIISIQDVQEKIRMNKREMILKEHEYKIWEGENKKWYTYVPDERKKNNRRLIKRSTAKSLDDAIVEDYYERNVREEQRKLADKENKEDTISIKTLEDLFPVWLRNKSKHTHSSSYPKRISTDWKKYYAKDPIAKIPLKDLTESYLDDWVHTKIKEYEFTKNQYFNMSIILRQALPYAVRLNIIDTNPFVNVSVSAKMYRKVKKKADETQVFLIEEQPRIEKIAYDDFKENGNLIALTIPLAFQIGARVGEIVALKESDIEEKYLHIQRMEVEEFSTDDGINFHRVGFKVVDHAKTTAGDRHVYLTSKAREIISMIIDYNKGVHSWNDDYLFVVKNERIKEPDVTRLIRKYCRKLNLFEGKGMHKIRKTFISMLIDSGININEIRKQVGHEDEKTTYKSYCFNRMSDIQTEEMLENALCNVSNIQNDPDPDIDPPSAKLFKDSNIIIFGKTRGNQGNQKRKIDKA